VELCEIRNIRRQFASSLGIKTYPIINEVPEHNYAVVIDCAGEDPVIPYIFAEQVDKVMKGGAIILVGVYFSEVSFNALSLLSAEIEIVPSFMYTLKEIPALPETMRALAEPLEKMTKRIPFEGLVDTLLEIEVNKDNFLKVVLYHADH
jgi:threonine dehydrogenase-like Zn-dependent dehydrogenase